MVPSPERASVNGLLQEIGITEFRFFIRADGMKNFEKPEEKQVHCGVQKRWKSVAIITSDEASDLWSHQVSKLWVMHVGVFQ